MATFRSVRELTRALQQGSKLLNDMFLKRKTLSIKYDEAVETLDGDENKLNYLIQFGVIVRSGDFLDLDTAYQAFFEEVLAVNEEINVASVKTYIDTLRQKIEYYLSADSTNRKSQFLRDIRHTFRSIEQTTRRSVIDLKRNVDDTYKQEQDFKVKELRLKDFDEKGRQIAELIRQTEHLMDSQPVFLANVDIIVRQAVKELRYSLHESAHGLIAIREQIIDYLNRIEVQGILVKRIRQLKYLKDQFMIENNTDIKEVLSRTNEVWMERLPKYSTKISLDFLRNDDMALAILSDVRRHLSKKTIIRSKLSGKIDRRYLEAQQEVERIFNHGEIMSGFLAQGLDLFQYIWNFRFSSETSKEQRLVLFLQLASQYTETLNFTTETGKIENIEYPLIYPL